MRKEPADPDLVNKILKEIEKHPDGIWIRKLARDIKKPLSTVYKYVNREDYCGNYIIMEKREQELGGNIILKLRGQL